MVKIRQEKKTFFSVFGKKSDPVITCIMYITRHNPFIVKDFEKNNTLILTMMHYFRCTFLINFFLIHSTYWNNLLKTYIVSSNLNLFFLFFLIDNL